MVDRCKKCGVGPRPYAQPCCCPDDMRAYYYGFTPTGCFEIDVILEAVAQAGKAYHDTSSWNDDEYSMVDRIQDAANRAAEVRREG